MKSLIFVLLLCLEVVGFASAKYKSISKTVTTAGTRVALSATDLYTSHFEIKAVSGNSGTVYVGGSDVAAANGYPLAANATVKLGDLMRKDMNEAVNLKDVYIDASANAHEVRVIYVLNRYKGSEPAVQ